MTQKRGVCLVRFDDILGPSCVYNTGLNNKFVEKVCLKSQLSTLSLSNNVNLSYNDFLESVIPFQDEGYTAYSTFFSIIDEKARGGKRTIGIITLVDSSENLFLYRTIPEISSTIKEIAFDINTLGDPKENLTERIKKKLRELLFIEKLKSTFNESNESVTLIKKRIQDEELLSNSQFDTQKMELLDEVSFEFLFNKIPIGLEKIIYALLRNERILVFGLKEEISLFLSTIRWFLPHKKIYNNLWTVPLIDAEALFSQTKDTTALHVLGIYTDDTNDISNVQNKTIEESLSLVNNDLTNLETKNRFDFSEKVTINLNSGEVKGGLSNRFCEKLLENILNKTYDQILTIITDYINYLLTRVNDLTNIIIEQKSKDELEQFIENSIEGEISLIITIINETNPMLMTKLLKKFSENNITLDILF